MWAATTSIVAVTIAEIEEQLTTQNADLEVVRKKIDGLKLEIIADLTSALPLTIDAGINDIIQDNPDVVNGMTDGQIARLRLAISETKKTAGKRVIRKLSSTRAWYFCNERHIGFESDSVLFRILASYVGEFDSILKDAGFEKRYDRPNAKVDLAPINLRDIRCSKIEGLAEKLGATIREYCHTKRNIVDLQEQLEARLESKKALSRWKAFQ